MSTVDRYRIDFHEPVHVGELLPIAARVVCVGRTSMEIEIALHAKEIASGSQRHTNTCHFTFVALERDAFLTHFDSLTDSELDQFLSETDT